MCISVPPRNVLVVLGTAGCRDSIVEALPRILLTAHTLDCGFCFAYLALSLRQVERTTSVRMVPIGTALSDKKHFFCATKQKGKTFIFEVVEEEKTL